MLFGLSAIGVVAIFRAVQKGVKRLASRGMLAEAPNAPVEIAVPADRAS